MPLRHLVRGIVVVMMVDRREEGRKYGPGSIIIDGVDTMEEEKSEVYKKAGESFLTRLL